MAANNFDLKGFLNDPKVQADKPAAVQFLKSKGILDASGNVVPSMVKPAKQVGAPQELLNRYSATPANIQAGKNFAINAIPAVGATVGAIGGGFLGGLVAAPTVAGIPAGAFAGAVGGSAAGGAAGEAIKEKIQGNAISPGNVGKAALGYGALEAVGGPLIKAGGSLLEAAGSKIAQMFIPKSEVEAGLLQTYKAATPFLERVKSILGFGGAKAPQTAASTAFEKGLVGTESMMGVQAKRAQNTLWNGLIKPALQQSKAEIDIPAFFKDAEEKIVQETNDPTRLGVLKNALNSIKEDFGEVGKITLDQLQKYKEGWAEFVPEKAYKGQPIAGALNDVRNTLAEMSREKIYSALGDDVKQAYLDYTNLYGIKKLGVKAMAGGIIKAGGTFTGLKSLWEMTTVPIGTIAGQVIYKVGQAAEFIGAPGARILRDVLFGATNNQQTQSAPNPQSNTPATPPQIQ